MIHSVNWVHFIPFGPFSILGFIWTTSIQFNPIWFILYILVPFSPPWSYSIYSIQLGLIGPFCLFGPLRFIQSFPILRSIWSTSVHSLYFSPVRSIQVTSVHFGLFRSIQSTWSTLVLFSPIRINSILFDPFWTNWA